MFRVCIDTVKMLCAPLAKKRRTSAVGKVQGVSLAFSAGGTTGFKWSTSPNIAVSSFAIVRVYYDSEVDSVQLNVALSESLSEYQSNTYLSAIV